MTAYYNEFDPYAAAWLRNLISAGHIAPGDVDERSIADVRPDDLRRYTQCHFFAGIGGWSYAARLAGWPDDRPLWTGSCPCQPFSVAGKGGAQDDSRHLWPVFFDLIRSCRPDVVMGEQVAAAVGKDWLDGVHSDLEGVGYACGAAVVPACAVDAPHRRDRLWFVANATRERGNGRQDTSGSDGRAGTQTSGQGLVANADGQRGQVDQDAGGRPNGSRSGQEPGPGGARDGDAADADIGGPRKGLHDPTPRHGHSFAADDRSGALADRDGQPVERRPGELPSEEGAHRRGSNHGPWGACEWLQGADGKARRVEPSIRLLAHGVPARVGKLRAYGNAIVPQVAAEILGAYLDCQAEFSHA